MPTVSFLLYVSPVILPVYSNSLLIHKSTILFTPSLSYSRFSLYYQFPTDRLDYSASFPVGLDESETQNESDASSDVSEIFLDNGS